MKIFVLVLLFAVNISALGLQSTSRSRLSSPRQHPQDHGDRRVMLQHLASVVVAVPTSWSVMSSSAFAAASTPDLTFVTAPSGLQYADAKVGTGAPIPPTKGSSVTIDYVMSTSGARYGSKIYSTAESNIPYRFKVGDGTTIQGLEQGIVGGNGIEAMRPGGIRRLIVPSSLAYETLARPIPGNLQFQDCQEGKGVGPIPPVGEGTTGEYFQRFKNIYCNANRPYQPDLVLDIKLYGKR